MTVHDEGFASTNAAFIDLVIRRWERIIDFHTSLRHGMFDPENPPSAESLQLDLVGLKTGMDQLRKDAKKAKKAFPLDRVVQTYGLDQVEVQILELALIPQLDLSFRQRIARYNNNILYDFVDVDVALGLLFSTRVERLQARSYFGADATLIKNKLVQFRPPKESKGTGVLAQELRPPERLADYCLCRRSLETSVRPVADLVDPTITLDKVALPSDVRAEVTTFIEHFSERHGGELSGGPFTSHGGLTIALVGDSGTGKTMLSHAIATELHRPLIAVDSVRLAAMGDKADALIDTLFIEASVMGAVLLFDRCDPLLAKGNARLPAMLGELDRFGGLAILVTSKPDELDGGVERHVAWQQKMEMPDPDLRTMIWRDNLPTTVPHAEDVDPEDLGTRYEITGAQIRSACVLAEKRVTSTGPDGVLTLEELKNASMAQLRADMEEYSVRSKVTLTLDDLVMPEKEKILIREVLQACQNRVFVMSKWGFGRRLVTGKGICVLFKGEPGTGKTLCAEILARELGMRLYQISIPKIVSKYIGETEKNIAKIFSTARANHSMLLFDEADALFTKRVAVDSAVDRFSNMEVNLLLQEIERFEGITILTTNLDKNIDDAFSRRINFKIDFPFPKPEHRSLIWKGLFPKECPLSDDVDFEWLGESYELSGGFIKNAVVRAAYRAAADNRSIGVDDIEFAAEQECKSAGKLFRSGMRDDEW